MRVAYLGPDGTYSHEAVMASAGAEEWELVPLPTVHETIMAVHGAVVDRALVPIENSLEGSVNATLDTLAVETDEVAIVGEVVHAISHCLIARPGVVMEDIRTILSHPQAAGQCARFLRERMPAATVTSAPSTADAVRTAARSTDAVGALGNHLSAQLYGGELLAEGVEDVAGNQTRFVWLARPDAAAPVPGDGPWKTSIVFWGAGDDTPGWLVRCLSELAPGWLVRCLSELADRGVNLTMIESRPRRLALGHYMFFADLQGHADDPAVEEALAAVAARTEALRVLGSYSAA